MRGSHISKNRLRLILGLFFFALLLPTAILIKQAFSQMKWETFRQYQIQAEELAQRIDNQFDQLIKKEEARPFSEYSFLNIAGDATVNFLQRSPLAEFPIKYETPGIIGYFQVDNRGEFSTPLLPPATPKIYGINSEEYSLRLKVKNEIQHILSSNQLVSEDKPLPVKTENLKQVITNSVVPLLSENEIAIDMTDELSVDGAASQAAFDRLKKGDIAFKEKKLKGATGRVSELKTGAAMDKMVVSKQRLRKEQVFLPEAIAVDATRPSGKPGSIQESIRITTFESEIDPFSFDLLDSGHFVLHRKVWRNGQRYTQGILFDQQAFLQGIVESLFKETSLFDVSNLVVAYQGEIFSTFSGLMHSSVYSTVSDLNDELLYQTRLSNPLAEMQLIFSVTRLPLGAGANLIIWATFVIALVLLIGVFFIYRLGVKQIILVKQQQDFVSAVSHELKTPLTSIRMYGEMLREGWATEEKKKTYYNYIHDESERLSRLIDNVLQLARMTRNDLQLNIKPIMVSELVDIIRSKISSQLERNGFELSLDCSDVNKEMTLNIDSDAFAQVFINLVDNAVKFSRTAKIKQIDIVCKKRGNHSVEFSVRDYGPGVAKNQMRKIFKLFYRTENELTRETVGTGIGLALVNQLINNMNGKVDVVNRDPGAEFRIVFFESSRA